VEEIPQWLRVQASSEHNNELLGSVQGGDFLDKLSMSASQEDPCSMELLYNIIFQKTLRCIQLCSVLTINILLLNFPKRNTYVTSNCHNDFLYVRFICCTLNNILSHHPLHVMPHLPVASTVRQSFNVFRGLLKHLLRLD